MAAHKIVRQLQVKDKAPKVEFETLKLEDSTYSTPSKKWLATTLLQACKDQGLKPFDLPLAGIDIGVMPWSGLNTIDGIAFHFKRVNECDITKPVILTELGFVADGWHRIVKALATGKTIIKAYRLQKMPDPDEIIEEGK